MSRSLDSTKPRKNRALRGAAIFGGLVISAIAINALAEMNRQRFELNYLRDDVEALKETANEAIHFMRP